MTEYQEKLKLAQMLQEKYRRLDVSFSITTFKSHFSLVAQIEDESKLFPIVDMAVSHDFTIDELYELNAVLDAESALKA